MSGLFSLRESSLARQLVGRTLVVGDLRATIVEAQPFPRSDTEKPLYRPLLELEPGGVYTPRQYSSVLFHLLAAGGGCVGIRAIELDGQIISGPGRVTEALGLTTPKNTGRIRELKSGDLKLEMDTPPDPPKRAMKKAVAPTRTNGLGRGTIARHMRQIAQAWMKAPARSRPTIEKFVDGILETCHSEAELRRFLRERLGK